eukprot:SAG31_NODE_697_length_12745_cov_67.888502_12_plen_75_part_00
MEQLYCFQNAAVVIGVEGAGLTNSVVMQRGASVINLHPAAPTARFSTLVSSCGQSYFCAHFQFQVVFQHFARVS